MKLKITAKEIRKLGYPEGPVVSIAMRVMEKHFKHASRVDAFEILKSLLAKPEHYIEDETLGIIAKQLQPIMENSATEIKLNTAHAELNVFGQEFIEEGAMHQIYQAAKLPVAIAAALMPDAHSGYGLPIGGVLATDNAVIPYGVGVDIGCRMCLSIFNMDPKELSNRASFFAREINEVSLFGSGAQFEKASNHEVMERSEFNELRLLRSLQGKAWKQLGSSGSGNHFVEFGVVELTEKDEVLGVEKGMYIGLLTHSGSRALGANIATHYTKIAIEKRRLPAIAKNLAWLNLDEEEGMEYWIAMNLAGDYASACHQIIHDKLSRRLSRKAIARVENHHNFAWKEIWNQREVIVHRKGATPAGKDVLGIIPGSMTANGYIVKGRGEETSINSAAHGAGRRMSRSTAMKSISQKSMKDELIRHDVKLIGGGLDEAPFAYKDIDEVMKSQKSLVDVIGKFTPKIVMMDGAKHKSWKPRTDE